MNYDNDNTIIKNIKIDIYNFLTNFTKEKNKISKMIILLENKDLQNKDLQNKNLQDIQTFINNDELKNIFNNIIKNIHFLFTKDPFPLSFYRIIFDTLHPLNYELSINNTKYKEYILCFQKILDKNKKFKKNIFFFLNSYFKNNNYEFDKDQIKNLVIYTSSIKICEEMLLILNKKKINIENWITKINKTINKFNNKQSKEIIDLKKKIDKILNKNKNLNNKKYYELKLKNINITTIYFLFLIIFIIIFYYINL